MEHYLLIAEKPSLMRAIREAYESLGAKRPYQATFVALRGHFLETVEPSAYKKEWGKPWSRDVLPMIPPAFRYCVKPDCKKDYGQIREMITKNHYDAIVNCCDAGREGEAIFWNLIHSIPGTSKMTFLRLWAQDITVETLSRALRSLIPYAKSDDLCRLREAAIRRGEFDWLVGMNLSRAAMLTTKLRTSVGRVKTPTMSLVVQRDKAIAGFVPQDFFEVEADFSGYKGLWFDPKTKRTSFDKRADAERLISSLGNKGTVESVNSEQLTAYAPAPYSLAELQKEANSAFGFTAGKTLSLAQSLYETHKILSYPRTESRALSTALAKEIPDLLRAIAGVPDVAEQVQKILAEPERISRVCASKKYVDNKKVTDHHAIINTKTAPDLSKLSSDERKLYILVLKKFVAIFLDPYVVRKTTVVTDVTNQKFKTVGSVIEDIGYRILYRNDKSKETFLPPVTVGQIVPVVGTEILAKQTRPPEPYTDRTLIDAMQHAGKFVEDDKMKDLLDDVKGIGTSATRAGIIDELIQKGFLKREGKTIRADALAFATAEALDGKNILSPVMTAEWEGKLRQIEDGSLNNDRFVQEMNAFIQSETEAFLAIQCKDSETYAAAKYGEPSNKPTEVGVCPLCGKKAFASPKYIYCEEYKGKEGGCKFIVSRSICGGNISLANAKKLCNNQPTGMIWFISKNNKRFQAQLGYSKEEQGCQFIFASEKKKGG